MDACCWSKGALTGLEHLEKWSKVVAPLGAPLLKNSMKQLKTPKTPTNSWSNNVKTKGFYCPENSWKHPKHQGADGARKIKEIQNTKEDQSFAFPFE